MKEFVLHSELKLAARLDAVFPFFADARNLETLTPTWLNFKILTPIPVVMQTGTLIEYELRLHGLPLHWASEITVWDPPRRFVDEQRRGPYRRWIHEHRFEEEGGATLCVDHVQYAVPGGVLVEGLFVRPNLQRIFAFRRAKLEELFGLDAMPSDAPSRVGIRRR